MVREIGTPGIDLRAIDVRPLQPFPSAEVEFGQLRVDAMDPAPAAQPSPDIGASSQMGCDDDARQSLDACGPLNPAGEALRLAAIDGHVGDADASPCRADGPRMAPHVHVCSAHSYAAAIAISMATS